VGCVLDVRRSANVVEIFSKNRRVASHKRSYAKGVAVTEPAPMPSSHRRHAAWTPSRIVHWAQKTGPSTAAFIEALLASRPHPEQGFRSALGVLRLGKRYGPERLELACTLARDPVRLLDPAARPRPAPPRSGADAREPDTLQHPRSELLPMKEETC
jgi:transposase